MVCCAILGDMSLDQVLFPVRFMHGILVIILWWTWTFSFTFVVVEIIMVHFGPCTARPEIVVVYRESQCTGSLSKLVLISGLQGLDSKFQYF